MQFRIDAWDTMTRCGSINATLQTQKYLSYKGPDMRTIKRFLALGLLPLLLAGCQTTVTNLSPSQLPRNASGQYPLSVKWESSQQSLRPESLQGFVMIGSDLYPMQHTPKVNNRWDTLVPIPADKDVLNYRYKFVFEYNAFGDPKSNSVLSRPYQLKVQDHPMSR